MSNDLTQRVCSAMLAARLHDPVEKALILMRTPEGHEGGTSRELMRELFPDGDGPFREAVKRADQWAAAADRAKVLLTAHHDFPSHQESLFRHRWDRLADTLRAGDPGWEPPAELEALRHPR